MPFLEIDLKPGVDIEATAADSPGGVQTSNFIRWRANLPEKRGGCSLFINQQLQGYPSSLKPWGDIDGNPYLGVATDQYVYAYNTQNYNLTSISPEYFTRNSNTLTFSTVQGTSLVTITDPNAVNLSTYDSVEFNVPVSVGGLILYQTYPITTPIAGTTYTIDVGYNATSTVTNVAPTLPVFTTVANDAKISVNFPIKYQYNDLQAGNRIGFAVPTTVGGTTIVGQYVVYEIIDDTHFTFYDNEVPSSADTKTMNSGNVNLTYWKTNGPTTTGGGYGSNPYGQYGYGQGAPSPAPVATRYTADRWYLDNIQSTLIASAVGGPIFSWSTIGGYANLSILANGPSAQNGAFVAMPQGQIMAWGCNDAINPVQNPLYIRWSDTNFLNWTIGGQSQAGFYTIPTGSKIVRGVSAQTVQYWFTDVDMYTAQYVGYPSVFGFTKVGSGCGLVAPQAVGVIGNSVYWMSQKQFFTSQSGGSPAPIPCSVWDFIFQNLDQRYIDNVVCGTNSLFNEVSWFFPSTASANGVPDAYVCLNVLYGMWDFGYINRTAWSDQSLLGPPVAADSEGWVYQHETSNNLADGLQILPIVSQLTTGYYSMASGQDLSFCDWILPDFKWGQYNQAKDAQLNFTFYVTDYAGQSPKTYGPYSTTQQTEFITPRFRGRYVAMKIESDDLNSFWRLGSIRMRIAPSGRR